MRPARYAFLPSAWIGKVSHLSVGAFKSRCGAALSGHVPMVVDVMSEFGGE